MTTSHSTAVITNSSPQLPSSTSHDSEPTNENNQEADVGQGLNCDIAKDQTENNRNAVDSVLNVAAEVACEKIELSVTPDPARHALEATSSTTTTTITPAPTINTANTSTANGPRLSRSLSRTRIDTNKSNSLAIQPNPSPITPATDEFPPAAIRKTSPGLAARLKALGFGTSVVKKTVAPVVPQSESIGRLDEQQLRQLDEKHQAGSVSAVIARRGRPWKGAGGFPSLHKSVSQPNLSIAPVPVDIPLLPEIRTPEPLAMDTHKYRLPDHTNGNGTKVTLETRREHLERNTRPLSPPPPSPPPKDTPPPPAAAFTSPTEFVPDLNSYFSPNHNRPGSIYTLSRASFASQLAQLTSLQLPDAESLSSKVSAIPTAQVASRALINAAEQIRSWISKAQEVISGLDSEDDVEWAAAGGREGLEEVENAIIRFQGLINAYVGSIDQLQQRSDISNVTPDDLRRAVAQMETIVQEWAKIKRTLQCVRVQVEIAMEWEELWNNVLGDIQGEMDELSRLVFEMEERRHKSLAVAVNGDGVDIGDLETIVEEESPKTGSRLQAPNRFSISSIPMTPSSPGTSTLSQDDSNLLALFARMQPLRASLDFLPMRLSVFETRAEQSFPTACDELEMRREGLDASYKKLEQDAESLRKELGEDRWVIVFRGAGRQAQKMHESVERSLIKLKDAVDAGMHLTNQPTIIKKIESYEAKKTHYGPAVERVLSIIDKGVQDRLTVNGEILRLHHELQSRWESLKRQMEEMDVVLEDIHADRKSQQLRDSVSSMLSMDNSNLGSPRETPGSSPPSSVIMSGLGLEPLTPASKHSNSLSPNSMSGSRSARRQSSIPAPVTTLRNPMSRLSTITGSSVSSPIAASAIPRSESSLANRPRWNTSTNTADLGISIQPSKTPQRSISAMTPLTGRSRLPTLRSSLSRSTSESPKASETSPRTGSRLSFRDRLASPGPQPRHKQLASLSRRSTIQSSTMTIGEGLSSRPGSSLGASRRSSMMPQAPKGKKEVSRGTSPLPGFVSRFGSRRNSSSQPLEPRDLKPRWRF
ncbi:hypothetical protein PT974_08981 [Cladobotryum mycophilum]|uniref:Karyogamy protein n=1 Tax=Cladobotryum mycophilum TaxID=491253 RepID=A0ABR0SEY4_9HYPO